MDTLEKKLSSQILSKMDSSGYFTGFQTGEISKTQLSGLLSSEYVYDIWP